MKRFPQLNKVIERPENNDRTYELLTLDVDFAKGVTGDRSVSEEERQSSGLLNVMIDTETSKTGANAKETRRGTLKIVLISDPSLARSAAAASVLVGSNTDPREAPGLAHFCEHMLFMGSGKYPDENDFSKFLVSHGSKGYNAFTQPDFTTYYFDIEPSALEPSFDRLVQFFVDPLFGESSVGREINAIEQEHKRNLKEDAWRSEQLLRCLSDPQHNYHRFCTGDIKTLSKLDDVVVATLSSSSDTSNSGAAPSEGEDSTSSTEEPKTKLPKLVALLKEFHSTYYVPDLVTYALVGPQSIDQLREIVSGIFKNLITSTDPDPDLDFGSGDEEAFLRADPFPFYARRLATDDDRKKALTDSAQIAASQRPTTLPFRTKDLGKVVQVECVQNKHSVQFLFQLPSLSHHYKVRPLDYISHLVGHEGPGSILSFLKQRGLATELFSSENTSYHNFSLFSVVILLTSEGLDSLEFVSQVVFAYLNLIVQKHRQLPDNIIHEIQAINTMNFRFKEKSNPSATAIQFAKSLHLVAPSRILASAVCFENSFDQTIFEACLPFFTPQNCLIIVSSKEKTAPLTEKSEAFLTAQPTADPLLTDQSLVSFILPPEQQEGDSGTWLRESVYQVNFRLYEVKQEKLESLGSVLLDQDQLHLPRVNPFIATDFTIKNANVQEIKRQSTERDNVAQSLSKAEYHQHMFADRRALSLPKLAKETEIVKLWFKQDDRFFVPKANCFLRVLLPHNSTDPRASLLLKLFCFLLENKLNEFAYDATVANLQYQIEPAAEGINLIVYGYNQKMATFITTIFKDGFKDFTTSEQTLKVYKEKVKNNVISFWFKQPSDYANYFQNQLANGNSASLSECLEIIDTISHSDLVAFHQSLFDCYKIEALIHGNLVEAEAIEIVDAVVATLSPPRIPFLPSFETLNAPRFPALNNISVIRNNLLAGRTAVAADAQKLGDEQQAKKSPCWAFEFEHLDQSNANNCLVHLFLLSEEDTLFRKQNVLLEFIEKIMNEPIFNQLRTNEQLGYVVGSSALRFTSGYRAIRTIIMSAVADPIYLVQRLRTFIDQFSVKMTDGHLTDELFESFKDGMVLSKVEKFNNLGEESIRYWTEISNHWYCFDRPLLEAEVISTLTKDDVVQFWAKFFDFSSYTRELSFQIFQNNTIETVHQRASSSSSSSSSSSLSTENPLSSSSSGPAERVYSEKYTRSDPNRIEIDSISKFRARTGTVASVSLPV